MRMREKQVQKQRKESEQVTEENPICDTPLTWSPHKLMIFTQTQTSFWISPETQHMHMHLQHHPRRQECPDITNMAMGYRAHSFPVGGMFVEGIGRLTKVKRNPWLLFSIAS